MSSHPLFHAHGRNFEDQRYVYPVLSRRSRGISIGVNLSPDLACNFRCVYCQVDRSRPGPPAPVNMDRLRRELDQTLELVASGRLFHETKFRDTPEALRRLSDVALSGNGEPTLSADLEAVVRLCAEIRRRNREQLKLLLITNGTLLDEPRVRRALEILDANHGEIWAKLDAGTESHYLEVNRSAVPWQQVLANLREAARTFAVVIQSMFMRLRGRSPDATQIEAYCRRLGEILDAGGRIRRVQVLTVARARAENWVAALGDEQLDAVAELIRRRTGLLVETFYGGSPVAGSTGNSALKGPS